MNEAAKELIQKEFREYLNSKYEERNELKSEKEIRLEQKRQKQEKEAKRLALLILKRQLGKESLAERFELEKLKILTRQPELLRDALLTTGKVASAAAKNVANSKAVKGIGAALLYSNPITAFIAESSDLFKGVGKVAGKALKGGASFLYDLTRRKQKPDKKHSIGSGLIPSAVTGSATPLLKSKQEQKQLTTSKLSISDGTNYIAAKTAMFVGGTNNIVVASGGFSSNAFSLTPAQGNQDSEESSKLLGGPKLLKGPKRAGIRPPKDNSIIDMKKGIDGIYKATTASNVLLKAISSKYVLITSGILLAGALILGIFNLLKNKFNIGDPKGKALQDAEIKKFKLQNNQDVKSLTTASNQSINKLIKEKGTGVNNVKYEGYVRNEDFHFNRLGKTRNTRLMDKVGMVNRGPAQLKTQSLEVGNLTPVAFPVPVIFGITDQRITEEGNAVDIQVINKKGDQIWILGLVKIVAPEYTWLKPNFTIGFSSGKLNIIGDDSKFMNDNHVGYTDYINNQKMNNFEDLQQSLTKNRTDKLINQQFKELDKQQGVLQKGYDKDIRKSELYGSSSKDSIESVDNQGKPKISISKDNYNTGNRNEQLALSNVSNRNKPSTTPSTQSTKPDNSMLAMQISSSSTTSFNISEPSDIRASSSSLLGLTV